MTTPVTGIVPPMITPLRDRDALDVPGLAEPATGRLGSIPAIRSPILNDIHLRRGRWIETGRPDEVIASEALSRATLSGLKLWRS